MHLGAKGEVLTLPVVCRLKSFQRRPPSNDRRGTRVKRCAEPRGNHRITLFSPSLVEAEATTLGALHRSQALPKKGKESRAAGQCGPGLQGLLHSPWQTLHGARGLSRCPLLQAHSKKGFWDLALGTPEPPSDGFRTGRRSQTFRSSRHPSPARVSANFSMAKARL